MMRAIPRRFPIARSVLVLCAAVALACAGEQPGADRRDTDAAPAGGASDSGARGTGSGAPSDTGGARPDEPSLAFPADSGTAGVTARPRPGIEPVILRAVRTATHEEFDRVVFEFDTAGLPGYHIEYVDRPVRQCGSGEPVEVAGDGWLQVRMEPARAHEFRDDTTVTATITDRNRRVSLPTLRQLVLTCDFEAQVEWVLGVASPNRYRVLELQQPSRLVVDVRR